MTNRTRRRRRRRERKQTKLWRPLLLVGVGVGLAIAAGAAWLVDTESRARRHVDAAKVFYEGGDVRAAVLSLQNAVQASPDNLEVRFRLGQALLRAGDSRNALEQFDRVISLGFEHPELELLRVRALLAERDFERAIDSTDQASADESIPDLLTMRGLAQLGSRQVEDAWTTFSSVLDQEPGSPGARRGLARVALVEGDIEEANSQIGLALDAADDDIKTWLLKGELELVLERYARALESFGRALKLSPDDLVAHSGLARALIALERPAEATKHVDAVASRYPRNPTVNYLQARVAQHIGDVDGVKLALRAGLKSAPDHTDSLLLLAQTHFGEREYEQAEELLLRYVSKVPDRIAPRRLLAAVLLATGRAEAAVERLIALETAAPRDPKVLELLGAALLQTGNVADGRRYLERAVELAPDDADLRTRLAMGHLSTGEPSAAVAALEAALNRKPSLARANSMLVLALINNREFGMARDAAQKLVEQNPGSAKAWNALGAAQESGGYRETARTSYRKALTLDSSYPTAALNLARLLRQEGDEPAARAVYDALLEKNPGHAGALVALARMAGNAGRPKEAVTLLQRARAMNHEAISPRLTLAGYHLRGGSLETAQQMVEEAQRIAPNHPRVLLALGRVHLANGRADEAIDALTRLTRAQPRSADAHFRLALAYEQKRDHNAMRNHLERTLALDPDHELAKAGIGSLNLVARKPKAALGAARSLLAARPDNPAGHLLMGDALMTLGKAAAAVSAYEKAFRLVPSELTLVKLHGALLRAGRVDRAVQNLRTWLEDRFKQSGVRLLLASTLERQGQTQLAIVEYERILFDQPGNAMALNNLAWLYHERKDPRALELAKRAFEGAPDLAQVADTYGWLLTQTGEAAQGITLLERARERAPDDAGIRYHHAAALASVGEAARARRELEGLLASAAKFPERRLAETLLESLQ